MLTPLAVGPGQPFPYISGLSLSLGVLAVGSRRRARSASRASRCRRASTASCAVGKRLVPLEAVIAHFLPMLFPGMEIAERAVFRVTRDADFEVSDDADDLLEAVESELRRRRFGDVVRLELSSSASRAMRERLVDALGVRPSQVYEVEGLLDQADLWQLVALDRPELKYEPSVPVVPPRWARAKSAARVFDEIRRGDLFVHHPYESFRASFEAFAQAAARDPDVIAIKTTVYRTSDDSALVSSLIECAEEGKQSVCLVELKARFDERRNIEWSRSMEQAGVHVVHGFPDLKIHAKMTLVVRREENGLRRYVHIGTGNYNASTARLYEDVGHLHRGRGDRRGRRRPLQLRDRLRPAAALPQDPRRAVHDAKPARRRDPPRRRPRRRREPRHGSASSSTRSSTRRSSTSSTRPRRPACQIEICARSICMLRPGVRELSETIRVRSIVGRFLEHSRIYWFEAGDETSVYIGSADLMPRNLDRRIEVADAGGERPRPLGGRRDPRQRLLRHDEHVGARAGRRLDAARGEERQGAHAPDRDDAPRPAAGEARPLVGALARVVRPRSR